MLFKSQRCKDCGDKIRAKTEKRPAPRCKKCGGVTYYSERWYCRLGGTVRALSPKKSDALIDMGRLGEEISQGVSDHSMNTLGATAREFLRWAKGEVDLNNLAPGTYTSYEMRINSQIIPRWDKLKLRHFCQKADILVDAYRRERSKEVTPATINRDISTLKRVLSWAKSKKLIAANPLEGYSKLYENNERDRVLSDEELIRLRQNISGHVRLLVEIGLNTGLRLEGALTLKWQEISFDAGTITKIVKHHRKRKPRQVIIPLTRHLREILLEHKRNQKVFSLAGYVVPSKRDLTKPMRVTSDWGLKKALQAAKISDFSYHDFRRNFATRFLLATGDIHTLANLLGHSTTYVTERYAHMLDGHRTKAMEVFAKFESSL